MMKKTATIATLTIVALLIISAETVFGQTGPVECVTIDFETIPGETLEEGLIVSTQFLDSLGISFSLDTDGNDAPRLAEVGSPATAFDGAFGGDTPAPDQNIGSFFLTDDGVLSGLNSPPLIVSFTSPADSASGVVLDIDFNETFTIEARDATDQTLEKVTISAGDPGTGDALATSWSFSRDTADVSSIRFVGSRTAAGLFGLGFDKFTSCVPARATSVDNVDLPTSFILRQNYPNPFNPSTTIEYELLQASHVRMEVYSIEGRRIAVLADEVQAPGRHQIDWKPDGIATGTYIYRLYSGEASVSRKLTFLK